MKGYLALFILTVAADVLATTLSIPVPGSILGMIALLGWFLFRGKVDEVLADAAGQLLKYLALLLVPVGVAVVDLTGGMNGALALMVVVSILALFLAVLTSVMTIRIAQWFLSPTPSDTYAQ